MGMRVQIGTYSLDVLGFVVGEDSTPLAAGDTSGGVGSFQFTIAAPDPDVHHPVGSLAADILTYGPAILFDRSVVVVHTELGSIPGVIVDGSLGDGVIRYQGVSDLNRLNAYDVRALPYSGTLGGLFRYYLSLVKISPLFIQVDSALDGRPISVPGWSGELWYHLKALAVAHDAEIALTGPIYSLRQIRTRYASKGRGYRRSQDLTVPTLAQSVEVYRYNNRRIVDELVYPVGGWTEETEVLNVNAGEWAEYTLPLSASVTSIQEPVMLESVPPEYEGSSVYTVVANDGLPVTEAMWTARGGRLLLNINRDTRSLRIRIRGATRVPMADGSGTATNFSLALGSDATGNRYSTLRLVGTGVAFDKQILKIRTGVPDSRTGTEVGTTIDNPFISNKNQAYRAGVRAAVAFAGPNPGLSAEVTNVVGTGTQTFGNVAGSRVYDAETKRYYRVRSGSTSEAGISIQADDDLTHDDVQAAETGRTYAQVQAKRGALTYQRDRLIGLV